MVSTGISWQTDRPDRFRYRYNIVESEQSDVVVEVEVAEVAGYCSQYEPSFRFPRLVAAVVFAERHFYHEPHKPENKQYSVNQSVVIPMYTFTLYKYNCNG